MSDTELNATPVDKQEDSKEEITSPIESLESNSDEQTVEKKDSEALFSFLPKELILSIISPSSFSDSVNLVDIDAYIKNIDDEIINTEVRSYQIQLLISTRNNFSNSTNLTNLIL
jgi:hypothetical protein